MYQHLHPLHNRFSAQSFAYRKENDVFEPTNTRQNKTWKHL